MRFVVSVSPQQCQNAQMRLSAILLLSILLTGTQKLNKPVHSDEPTRGEWGDQRDGTYANPVLPGDFSDLDAIRVGDDFYAISSTLQYSPGMAVLHSKDLVNWEMVGHVVADQDDRDATVADPQNESSGTRHLGRCDSLSRQQILGVLRHSRPGYFYE